MARKQWKSLRDADNQKRRIMSIAVFSKEREKKILERL